MNKRNSKATENKPQELHGGRTFRRTRQGSIACASSECARLRGLTTTITTITTIITTATAASASIH
ncbi:hypothetical protein E2C01_060234 [Portunus trituberculatus]|uniref:Uncharacterized protein n=1 Tax=Portunus trituberculatus TaxID=210409 RepID=A0A5B7H0F1_PORTR|nr:hypothetical protein [Portunus trituberculatus]